jgi:hypothetical protein
MARWRLEGGGEEEGEAELLKGHNMKRKLSG